ncbi:hypothetical protein [Vibrio cyclitrophicus]|uniref:hypothetical protein n=1 Tax=Vibrio cyclitrophicus TaxID=47951 RepID=UPI0002E795DF|nr:hypothetical protein [Vibrio cyclitrophicus]OEF30694.1 hypothetical protein OA9_20185 [Vibrio cyclitrophicus 1F97]OEF39547.1 hypothetical protein OAC_12360 [Vibrio cyclitrophicus 1F273]OEF79604.1 hypothetical protein OA5_02055 [Vibrio cyclitrophicus 1F111]
MNEILVWFSSPLGVAIAWFCTVVGFIYALVQRDAKNKLSVECETLEANNYELKQQIINIQNNSTHGNQQDVNQEGTTNINAGVMHGDVNLNQ